MRIAVQLWIHSSYTNQWNPFSTVVDVLSCCCAFDPFLLAPETCTLYSGTTIVVNQAFSFFLCFTFVRYKNRWFFISKICCSFFFTLRHGMYKPKQLECFGNEMAELLQALLCQIFIWLELRLKFLWEVNMNFFSVARFSVWCINFQLVLSKQIVLKIQTNHRTIYRHRSPFRIVIFISSL